MRAIINNVQLKAVAAWLPQHVEEMSALSALYGEAEVSSIIKATGIQQVRIADKDITAADMCQYAAEHLINREGIDKFDIDGLVFVSQTPDYILPATSISLQNRLGLSKDTVCIDIHYGCSGFIYGLFQAASWISCKACKKVLVLCGDTTTRMINPLDKSLRMVFGECGTATLVTEGNFSMGFHIQSDGSGADRLIVPAGGSRIPLSHETAKVEYDKDGNGRSQNDLFMDGAAIFNFAVTQVPKNIKVLLEDMQWEKEQVGLYALHQANEFMVGYVRKMLKVNKNIVPTNSAYFGNTGPATIPLLLSDLCSENSLYDLERTVMCGFGVGLSWGSIATNLAETHFYKPINK